MNKITIEIEPDPHSPHLSVKCPELGLAIQSESCREALRDLEDLVDREILARVQANPQVDDFIYRLYGGEHEFDIFMSEVEYSIHSERFLAAFAAAYPESRTGNAYLDSVKCFFADWDSEDWSLIVRAAEKDLIENGPESPLWIKYVQVVSAFKYVEFNPEDGLKRYDFWKKIGLPIFSLKEMQQLSEAEADREFNQLKAMAKRDLN